jgi:formate hydrogenlyase subunit 3/multisubunit Na+/H+ antiporter MnhD subunit
MTLLLLCIAVWLLLGVTAVGTARTRYGRALVYGGSLAVAVTAFAGAFVADAGELVLPLGLPWVGMHVRVDALSRVFLALVNFGAAGASLYALGYGRHEHDPARVLPFYPVFLAGMNLVILAADAYGFLFAWELMSLSSWGLVMADHRDPATARAGIVYLIMATFSGLALLLAFGLLAGSQGYDFASMRVQALPAVPAAFVLALAIIGAGSKAGLVPLHVWLPLAHPAAPSHVSALMSGVMTKVAVYAFLRIVFDLLGPIYWWWAVPVLLIGGASAVFGVLMALMERDLKRLLACSTIENIGIIFVAIGLAMALRANGLGEAAALALTAGLFHAVNHMLFKSALFYGAGAVLVATGTRNIEKLGGLIHRMPVTAVAFLVACMAIAGLPPLNGFASEWLLFQTILSSPVMPEWGLRLMVPTVGALLALAVALAAACFVRAFGISFLGRPRSAMATDAQEVDRWSLGAMIGFAGLCVLLGIFPGALMDALGAGVASVVGDRLPQQTSLAWLSIVPIANSRSSYNGLMVFMFVAVSGAIAAFAVKRLASRALRRAPPWDCGYPGLSAVAQYTGTSFAQPIRRVFGSLAFASSEVVEMPAPGEIGPARIRRTLRDLVWEWMYAPVVSGVAWLAVLFNRLQFLTIRRYLGFVFAALVILLLTLTVWQ